jgi:hypothetical protein
MGCLADDPVNSQPFPTLKIPDRALGQGTEAAVDRPGVLASRAQLALELPHSATTPSIRIAHATPHESCSPPERCLSVGSHNAVHRKYLAGLEMPNRCFGDRAEAAVDRSWDLACGTQSDLKRVHAGGALWLVVAGAGRKQSGLGSRRHGLAVGRGGGVWCREQGRQQQDPGEGTC